MSEFNDWLLDFSSCLIEYSICCVQTIINVTYHWDIWLGHIAKTEGWRSSKKKGWLQVQMGKLLKINQLCCPCACCVLENVARFWVLYAFCCFLLSRSPAMGNLIKVLGKDLENCPHFFLDFESKWAAGFVHVSVCLKCVQRRCSRSLGGLVEGYMDASCLVVDGVMDWVRFVIIRCSLVPLSTWSDKHATQI